MMTRQPNLYHLDTFKPLTLTGLLQLFLFLNLAASKIQPYYEALSAIQSQVVIDALSQGGLWHAHKPEPGDQPDDEDNEMDDDPDEGDPGGPSRPRGPGGPSGRGRDTRGDPGGHRSRGGRGGANRGKQPFLRIVNFAATMQLPKK
ncbi:hypothetical protein BS47DRAFT_1157451 [Hydnum rufescens UP504]|uniref:Uncharacterized protein n=1 Tax=Hydnum rufescens UP504 TaxID=1448309 RepID=A0A9P6B875_9AGAM|nr:hypothetical protein BS47DRAFT_1157451 [Hydnum rufescens UP504]